VHDAEDERLVGHLAQVLRHVDPDHEVAGESRFLMSKSCVFKVKKTLIFFAQKISSLLLKKIFMKKIRWKKVGR
jgi:hypothetical protein